MLLTKTAKRNIVLFAVSFLLLGVLRVLLYGKDFAISFGQIYACSLTILWGIAVRKRITDKRLRALMLWIAAFLLLQSALQFLRYEVFFGNIPAQRFLWYAYYCPMSALPTMLCLIAFSIHRPPDKPLPRRMLFLIAVGAFLVLGFMTNDLHFLAKSFPSGILDDNGQEKSGPLFYAINVYIYGLYALAFAVIQKKNRRYVAGKYRWIAALPFLIGAVYLLLYPLDLDHMFLPTRIWNIGEMLAFCVVSMLEACVLCGMIPANLGYEILFSSAPLPAVILSGSGSPVYHTAAARFPLREDENTKRFSHPIRGGSVEYLVDMTQVRELNRQIEETMQQIEARNAYIAEENRIKREKAELETKNRLYERMSAIVKPQLGQIDALLSSPEGCGREALAKIAVLKAYIKRRSNMELLSEDGTLTGAELGSAAAESMSYLRLCGVNSAARSSGGGVYPAGMVTEAYEQIEKVTEETLDTLTDMIVAIRSEERRLTVRMMLKAENFSCEISAFPQAAEYDRRVSVTKEDQDMIIVLTFTEGGRS